MEEARTQVQNLKDGFINKNKKGGRNYPKGENITNTQLTGLAGQGRSGEDKAGSSGRMMMNWHKTADIRKL